VAGGEQPFDSLIVQKSEAVKSVRGSMDWTVEDNMVDAVPDLDDGGPGAQAWWGAHVGDDR